jgi:hypothetical protein
MQNKEFYIDLRNSMLENVSRIFDANNPEDKADATVDLYSDIRHIREALIEVMGNEYHLRAARRGKEYTPEEYAKEFNYPEIAVGNRKIGPGEEAWKNALAWKDMNEPYRQGYRDLVSAINNEARRHTN